MDAMPVFEVVVINNSDIVLENYIVEATGITPAIDAVLVDAIEHHPNEKGVRIMSVDTLSVKLLVAAEE